MLYFSGNQQFANFLELFPGNFRTICPCFENFEIFGRMASAHVYTDTEKFRPSLTSQFFNPRQPARIALNFPPNLFVFKVFTTIHNTRGSRKSLMLPMQSENWDCKKVFLFLWIKTFYDISNELKHIDSVMVVKTRILEFYRWQTFLFFFKAGGCIFRFFRLFFRKALIDNSIFC